MNNCLFLTFVIFICSTQFCFAQTKSKKSLSSALNYDLDFFNKNGSCKPFPEGVENRIYKFSSDCGGVDANIGLAKYSSNIFEVFFCVPQMNKSPLTMDKGRPLQGVYTRIPIKLIDGKIRENGAGFTSGPNNRRHFFGDNSVTLHTLGNGGQRTLVGSSKNPDECQIKIENIGTGGVIYSGGGRIPDKKSFDSKNMPMIQKSPKNMRSSGSEE